MIAHHLNRDAIELGKSEVGGHAEDRQKGQPPGAEIDPQAGRNQPGAEALPCGTRVQRPIPQGQHAKDQRCAPGDHRGSPKSIVGRGDEGEQSQNECCRQIPWTDGKRAGQVAGSTGHSYFEVTRPERPSDQACRDQIQGRPHSGGPDLRSSPPCASKARKSATGRRKEAACNSSPGRLALRASVVGGAGSGTQAGAGPSGIGRGRPCKRLLNQSRTLGSRAAPAGSGVGSDCGLAGSVIVCAPGSSCRFRPRREIRHGNVALFYPSTTGSIGRAPGSIGPPSCAESGRARRSSDPTQGHGENAAGSS